MRIPTLFGLLILLPLLLAGPAVAAEKPAGGKPPSSVTLDFKEVELVDLILTISELTGKNFIYDDTVKGKVTIISPRSMTMAEAYQVFLSVLNVKGFTVVPAGKVNKIVATRDAKENSLPTVTDGGTQSGEQYVTRLVPLQNADAATVASTVLAPLIPKTGSVVAFAPTNTLIITDSAGNTERLLEIIRQLDAPNAFDRFEVVALDHAAADEVAQIATQVLAQAGSGSGRSKGAAPGAKDGGKIIPYVRANALIVMGSEADIETVRGLVRELDRKPQQERSNINVLPLENADAETLAKTLNEILTGVKAQARAPRAAAGGAQPATNDPVTITADKPTNTLVISASPEDFATIRGIVRQLDVKRKQVFVEALILELSMDATRDLGVSLSGFIPTGNEGVVYGGMNQPASTGSNVGVGSVIPGTSGVPSLLTQSITGIMAGGLFNMITIPNPLGGAPITVPAISALINLSKTDGDVNILSAPRLLTSDNEEAEIVVGSNVPIITSRLTNAVGSGGGNNTGLAQSVTVERKDVALTLRFTPQVTEGNLVRLKVFQEITDLATTSVGNVNEVGPTLTKRLLQNTVLAENGKTVVLGGLIGNNSQVTEVKVPLLGDIPLLGWLFKRQNTINKKTNLLVFITPRIIRDAGDLAEVTRRSHDAMQKFRVEQMGQDEERDERRIAPHLNIEAEGPVHELTVAPAAAVAPVEAPEPALPGAESP